MKKGHLYVTTVEYNANQICAETTREKSSQPQTLPNLLEGGEKHEETQSHNPHR